MLPNHLCRVAILAALAGAWLATCAAADQAEAPAGNPPQAAPALARTPHQTPPQPSPNPLQGASDAPGRQVRDAVSPTKTPAANAAPTKMKAEELPEKWGIKSLALRRSAGNRMIDFRYRVLDPVKAAPLFDGKVHPYLVDEATGAKFQVPNPPKVGPLRSVRNPKAETNYFILFANPGEYLKPGNLVSIVIGGLEIEHLTLE